VSIVHEALTSKSKSRYFKDKFKIICPTFAENLIMNYTETLDFLYTKLPMYQKQGASAYKANLNNIIALCNKLQNPQNTFKSIHIAGTNGKGSVSHICASIFQEAGYKTGLYTSPHLLDFKERIKINGVNIPEQKVCDFVASIQQSILEIEPSFFEITVAMAFSYFSEEKVDIAIIETGLGGRLDSTNIITPEIACITNISIDHTNILGNTIEKIAWEKAGIIKKNSKVIIGEKHKNSTPIFKQKTIEQNAQILYSQDIFELKEQNSEWYKDFSIFKENTPLILNATSPLVGEYQKKNIITCISIINGLQNQFPISEETIKLGIANTIKNTNLLGRWQVISEHPTIVCDTAHNFSGVKNITKQLAKYNSKDIHIVWGMVNDKDISEIISLLPLNAKYYLCKPSIERGLDEKKLATYFNEHSYTTHNSVNEAYNNAIQNSNATSFIYIGGSTFVVADFLSKKR